MYNFFDSEFNEIAKNSIASPLLFFSENSLKKEYDEQNFSAYNYIDDEGQKTSNKIEENQNLYQNESSKKTQEKENIKYDEKPNIEISKTNNNENWNSDTEKEKNIDNVNDKIDNKEKTKKKKNQIIDFQIL